MEPLSSAVKAQSPNHWTARKFSASFYNVKTLDNKNNKLLSRFKQDVGRDSTRCSVTQPGVPSCEITDTCRPCPDTPSSRDVHGHSDHHTEALPSSSGPSHLFLTTLFPKLHHTQQSTGHFIKHRFIDPTPREYDSVRSWVGPIVCFPTKFPGGADATGPETMLCMESAKCESLSRHSVFATHGL